MRMEFLIGLIIVPVALVGCGQMEKEQTSSNLVQPGGQQEQAFAKTITKDLSCKYLLFLPEEYGKGEKQWPLMMFLHGAIKRGGDLNKAMRQGPPKIVAGRKDFPFIVVSPQCPPGDRWTKKTEVLIHLLDDIVARYDVDTERIYLTGLSMGGYGTWSLASEYPERFAAIVPICGGGRRFMAMMLKDVPVWAFHGAKDNVVPVKESEEMVNAVNARGGNARLTVYPDARHDSWTQTYNNQDVYDWLLSHRKSGRKKQ